LRRESKTLNPDSKVPSRLFGQGANPQGSLLQVFDPQGLAPPSWQAFSLTARSLRLAATSFDGSRSQGPPCFASPLFSEVGSAASPKLNLMAGARLDLLDDVVVACDQVGHGDAPAVEREFPNLIEVQRGELLDLKGVDALAEARIVGKTRPRLRRFTSDRRYQVWLVFKGFFQTGFWFEVML